MKVKYLYIHMCILNTYGTYNISVGNTIVYCPLMDFEISLSYISFFIPCGNEFGKLISISFTLTFYIYKYV